MTLFKRCVVLAFLFLLFFTEAKAVDFSVHGYYRLRFEYTHDLDLQRPNAGIVPTDINNNSNDRFGTIAYAQQRLRLVPHLKLNDHISFHGQIDIFDNILFGQSDVNTFIISNPVVGTITLPAANGPFGVVGTGDALNLNVKRFWVDILTSAGQFRIGRQPSQFGLGIFTNDGDGMEGDFGDTFDRIMYLAGLDLKNGHRLNFGLVFDYAFENSLDPSISGLDNGADSNWNDAIQAGLILMYQGKNFELGFFGGIRYRDGDDGEPTTFAIYIDNCADDGRPDEFVCVDPTDTTDPAFDQDNDGFTNDGILLPAGIDGDTLIYTLDLYGEFRFLHNYRFAFEAVYIGGKLAPGVAIDAIVLDDPSQAGLTNPLTSPIVIPLTGTQSDISVFMAAIEADAWWNFGGEVHIRAGFASGDSSPVSSKITQLGFRPDYDIALILFDQPIGTSPAIVIGGITELGRKPMSPNYINNAIYFTLEYKQKFDITSGIPWASDFKVGIKGITAWAPSNNLDLNFRDITGVSSLPHVVNASKWYGLEIDASVEAKLFNVLTWKTTAGVFIPGALYDIKNDNGAIDPTGTIDAILFDNAEIAIAVKSTLFFEF